MSCAQGSNSEVCLQVLPTQLIPDEKEGKVLRVRLIQKEGIKLFNPSFLFDEGSTISWIPCGRKLTCSFPGIKFFYGPDTYYGEEVSMQRAHPAHNSFVIHFGLCRILLILAYIGNGAHSPWRLSCMSCRNSLQFDDADCGLQ